MSENSSTIVSKVWGMCNPLRDDGLSYGDYLEQLTYLIFLKMSDEYAKPPYKKESGIPAGYTWQDMNTLTGAALEEQYKANAPKVLFADAVAASHTSILVGEMATLLRQNGVDIGGKRLFRFLRENGYLCSQGERYNLPTQRSMDRGWFEVKETTSVQPDGSIRVNRTTKISGKGQQYFIRLFLSGDATA